MNVQISSWMHNHQIAEFTSPDESEIEVQNRQIKLTEGSEMQVQTTCEIPLSSYGHFHWGIFHWMPIRRSLSNDWLITQTNVIFLN